MRGMGFLYLLVNGTEIALGSLNMNTHTFATETLAACENAPMKRWIRGGVKLKK